MTHIVLFADGDTRCTPQTTGGGCARSTWQNQNAWSPLEKKVRAIVVASSRMGRMGAEGVRAERNKSTLRWQKVFRHIGGANGIAERTRHTENSHPKLPSLSQPDILEV